MKTVNMTSSSNIILDHVTIGWSRYDNLGITKDSGQPESTNITIQNSLIHEAINSQRAGGIVDSSRNITLARNLWTNNDTRNPKGKGDLQYINNVVYNYGKGGYVGGHSGAIWYEDLINNYFIAGPSQSGDYLTDFGSNDYVYHSGNKIDDDKVDTGGDGLPEGRNIDTNKFNNVGATVQPTPAQQPDRAGDGHVRARRVQVGRGEGRQRAASRLGRPAADQPSQIARHAGLHPCRRNAGGRHAHMDRPGRARRHRRRWHAGRLGTIQRAERQQRGRPESHDPQPRRLHESRSLPQQPDGPALCECRATSTPTTKSTLADYVRWRNGMGTSYTAADYNTWRTNFGQTTGSGSAPARIPPFPSRLLRR